MKRVDPTEWANKKKAQLERAKQLREERKNALSNNDTFTPQINPPRRVSSGNVARGDSLDDLTNEVTASRPAVDDIMEMPLPGQRNRQQQNASGFDGAPSPGSDTLGRELKRHGGAPANTNHDIQPRNLNNTHFKSKFMQQYDYPENSNSSNTQRETPPKQKAPQPDPDDAFMNQLRGRDQRSTGPGWNDDTTFGGFDSANSGAGAGAGTRRGAAGRTKVSRPSVHRTQQQQNTDSQYGEDEYDTNNHIVGPPRTTPRSSNVQTKLTPRTAGEVRSNLSLLKSKIRQSESAGNPARGNVTLTGNGRNLAGSGGFEPEEDFQSSTGAQHKNQPSSYSRNSSKSSVNGMGKGISNVSFSSYASAYENDQEEPPAARQKATRPRPRGIADHNSSQYGDEEESSQMGHSSNRNVRGQPAQQQRQPQPPPQRNTGGGYEPSTGAGRNLSNSRAVATNVGGQGNNRANINSYNQSPSSPSIDDIPAVASHNKKGGYSIPPDDYDDAGGMDDDADGGDGPQMECPSCGRKFNPIPFQKHIKICEKVFLKKRKAFDSTKMRIQDNPELVKLYTKSKKEEDKAARKAAMLAEKQLAMAGGRGAAAAAAREEENFIVAKPKQKLPSVQDQPVGGEGEPLWKQQSKAFRDAMKAARMVKIAQETGAPLPPVAPSAPDPSLIPCPHCNRRFNQKAAERHIPQCQNIKAKPNSLKRGSGINAANGGGAASTLKGKGRF